MKQHGHIAGWLVTLALGATALSWADVPTHMSVQGQLSDDTGAPYPAGELDFTFKIFDAFAGGTEIWPGETYAVQITKGGMWRARIGRVTPLLPSVFADSSRWLEITIDDGVTPETLSRIRLSTAPFSAQASSADYSLDIADACVTSVKLAPGAVTAEKIADESVGESELQNDAISAQKLKVGSIVTSKVGDQAITASKLADGSVTTSKLAPNAVTGWHIQDGSISLGDLAQEAASTDKVIGWDGTRWRPRDDRLTLPHSAVIHSTGGAMNIFNLKGNGLHCSTDSGSWAGAFTLGIGTDTNSIAVQAHSQTKGTAVQGWSSGGVGGQFMTSSPYAYALHAVNLSPWHTATTAAFEGDGAQVLKIVGSDSALGVYSDCAVASAGGFHNNSHSTSTIWAVNDGTADGAVGGYFLSRGGNAVEAHSTTTGNTYKAAGRFESHGPNGRGVIGLADGTTSTGVYAVGTLWDFYAGGSGTNYGPFTGAHEVKLNDAFPANAISGMIVSASGPAEARVLEDGSWGLSSTLPTVTLSDKASDKAVFGVIVAFGALGAEHWYTGAPGERFATINALGEGRVWVTDFNGTLEVGDYITTSSVAGYGMKQGDDILHSYTLGKAIESPDWNTQTRTVEYNGKTYKAYLIAVVYVSG